MVMGVGYRRLKPAKDGRFACLTAIWTGAELTLRVPQWEVKVNVGDNAPMAVPAATALSGKLPVFPLWNARVNPRDRNTSLCGQAEVGSSLGPTGSPPCPRG